jgi:AcrR family transcriptional regulator
MTTAASFFLFPVILGSMESYKSKGRINMPAQQENKEKLINVAIELFASRGFKGTSIRDIAGTMGMSISNIYHYFGNKEGLLLGVLEHSTKRLINKLRAVSELDLDPLERFKKLVETHVGLTEGYEKEAKIFFLDEEHLSEEGLEINKKIQREIFEMYRELLRLLEQKGCLRSGNITVLTFNVLGVINWHLRWYRHQGPLSVKEVAGEIVSFILYGVLGGSPPIGQKGEVTKG